MTDTVTGVHVYHRVDDLPLDRLAALFTSGRLYDSPEWLRYCERSAAGNLRYLTLADRSGEMVGLAVLRIVPDRRVLAIYDLGSLIGYPDPDGDGTAELFPNGVASVSGAHCLLLVPVDGDAAVRSERRGRLARAVATLAEAEGCRAVGFLHVRDPATAGDIATALGPEAGRPFLLGAHTELAGGWPDFDGYLATLSASRRNKVRRERRQFLQSGLRIRVLHGTRELDATTARLQLAVRERYAAPGTVESILEDYEHLGGTVDDRIRVFLCERDGVAVGLSLALLDGGRLHLRLVGFDYAATGSDFVYFNVLFYEPIEWGIRNGITDYSFGSGGYTAKAARGCSLVPSYAVVRWPDALREQAWQRVAEREATLRAHLAPETAAPLPRPSE
jgi:uncharacterized protein